MSNMKKGSDKKGHFYLKWPWNALVYIALAVVLRIFAIPVILLLMSWNKKQQPNGPEEGFCLQRTRQRLTRLVWAILFLFIAAACGIVFYVQITGDRTGWEISDYVTLAAAGVISLACLAGGIYEGFTDIRDAFFPEKSRLARSIRSQLPHPEEAPDVKELFAMVDQDIRENGQWFDRVAVGKTWVLGDDVSAISRIRVVFGRDEIKRRHSNGKTHTTRIIELYIMDDRKQVQMTELRNPRELNALIACLKLRAPEALFRPYSEYLDYCGKSEEEWWALDRDFRCRLEQRKEKEEAKERSAARSNPDFILTNVLGQRTSMVSEETLKEQLSLLLQQGQRFDLEPVEPVLAGSYGSLTRMECGLFDDGLFLIMVFQQEDGSYQGLAKPVGEREAEEIFTDLLERKRLPDISERSAWQPLQALENRRQERPQMKLVYSDQMGAVREFKSFSRRDVELVGEGLANGRYTTATLYIGSRYLYLKAGDRMDGRVTANASRPDPDRLRVFETKCTDRQAGIWLQELMDGVFAPDFTQWKDITRQLEKAQKK